jgi:hypothetical protein
MDISKPEYNAEITEDELQSVLEDYLSNKLKQPIEVKYLKHNVGWRTEGHGAMEMDIPYQEGLSLTFTTKG